MQRSRAAWLTTILSCALSACGNGGAASAGASAGGAATALPIGGFSGSIPTGGASTNPGSSSAGAAGSAAGTMAVGAGGFSGDAGAAGGGAAGQPQHVGIYAPGSCSETNLRTGPPAGKAMFKTDPIDNKFPFAEHWVGEWIGGTDANHIGGQTLADLDGDGDLDFAAGQRSILPGGMIWWEQCTADHWVGHRVGTGQQTQASGDALDVDGDGLLDLLSGDSWFKNPGRSREMEWPRFNAHTPVAEELTVGDVTGDGKAEIMYAANGFNAQWWSPGPNPEGGFVKGGELGQSLQQGVAWGDLNGDGANDYLIAKDFWFENDGAGHFTAHPIQATLGFDPQPITYIGDLDGDGDNDFAMSTHWLGADDKARLAWVENLDGKGGSWAMHQLSDAHLYTHGVIAADFDNDGDLDIFWAQNVGPSFIFENTDGKGSFVEHEIVHDFRAHTPRAGDVDCDGDLDLVGSPWGDRNQASTGESIGMPARDVLYLQNMTVENGGKPIFDAERKPYEVGWPRPHCLK